jgi:hypothetical protein
MPVNILGPTSGDESRDGQCVDEGASAPRQEGLQTMVASGAECEDADEQLARQPQRGQAVEVLKVSLIGYARLAPRREE